MAAQVHGFQTEVTKLLNLLANSLYSNKDVFLRELISNASDAIDKLHFVSLTKPELLGDDPTFKIKIKADKASRTLIISDNGIGLTEQEAKDHLGTIAKSGTQAFFESLEENSAKDSQLIGQFGVGFYSAFIVADRVTVLSRSAYAKEGEAVRWESTGTGTYETEIITKKTRGTDIILHLKDDQDKYFDDWTLGDIITKYSDHISTPVELYKEVQKEPKEGETSGTKEFEYVQINDAEALWTKKPSSLTEEEYYQFYKHTCSDYQDPLAYAHNKVDGDLEYTSLLYLPQRAPFDLFSRQDTKHGLKLFVQRVFIMDDADQFLPPYLRFIKGLIDTNDLPLNVSREILQDSAVTRKLKKALTKRALKMIQDLSQNTEKYNTFITQFGSVLKEGVADDYANQQLILKLLRFNTTYNEKADMSVSLDDYVSRMQEKQKHIYYLTANSYEAAVSSPYLENLKKKGIEVLLLSERIDEWIMNHLRDYDGKEFVSATSPDLKLGELEDEEDVKKKEEIQEQNRDLIERFKTALGDKVTDIRISTRLVESPSCVVTDGNMFTGQMQKLLEAAGQKLPEIKYILEINPEHALVKKAYAEIDESVFAKWASIILNQAILSEQGGLKDPSSFLKEVNELLLTK